MRTRGVDGPALDLTVSPAASPATNGGPSADSVTMGGIITMAWRQAAAAAAPNVTLELRAARAAGQRAEIVRNGEVIATLDIAGDDATLTHAVRWARGSGSTCGCVMRK